VVLRTSGPAGDKTKTPTSPRHRGCGLVCTPRIPGLANAPQDPIRGLTPSRRVSVAQSSGTSGSGVDYCLMQVDRGDQSAAPPPRPNVAIKALTSEIPVRPRVIDVSFWLWVGACLIGLITALVTLRYFAELRTMILVIVEQQFPKETPATRDEAAIATVATLIGAGALIVLVQLALAVAMRAGRSWARFALVGLGLLGTLYSVAVFGSAPLISRIGLLASTALMVSAMVPMFLVGARTWFAHQRSVWSDGD
jgi:hypothetical protein